jgi:hypothetical protein
MKYNIIILLVVYLLAMSLLQCCYCAQGNEEIQNAGWEMKSPIISSLSSNPLLVENFRCKYRIRYGYATTADEAAQSGPVVLLGEYEATWNKDKTNELLDIRKITIDNSDMSDSFYQLGYDYFFLTNKQMSIFIDYAISQGSISRAEQIENPRESLHLTPISYIYIQALVDYFKEDMYKNEIRTLFEQENNLIKVSIKGKTPLRQLLLNPNHGYLPREIIVDEGATATYTHIFDYYSLENNKFFPKRVMEIGPDFNKNGVLDRRQVQVIEHEVTLFETKNLPSDFEFVSPQNVRIFDGKNLEDSQGYTLRENMKLGIHDLDTFYRLVLDSDKKQISPVQHFQFSSFGLRVFLVIIGIFCIILGYFLNRYYKKS